MSREIKPQHTVAAERRLAACYIKCDGIIRVISMEICLQINLCFSRRFHLTGALWKASRLFISRPNTGTAAKRHLPSAGVRGEGGLGFGLVGFGVLGLVGVFLVKASRKKKAYLEACSSGDSVRG